MVGQVGIGSPYFSGGVMKKDGAKDVKGVEEVEATEKSKLQDIKEKIENGEYKIDTKKTAERMAQYLLA